MRDLTLFTLGKNKYGIWQNQSQTVKEIEAIHWLPPVPKHIAGLSILDGQTVTLFDLPACIGLSPISKEEQSYPVLFLKHAEKMVGFIVDAVMGHFAIQTEAVYPIPGFLQTPIIDSCAMYDSDPILIINISRLYNSAQNVDFEPCMAECRIGGAKPQKTSSIKSVRVFESGGETFAIPVSGIEKAAVKPGRLSRPPLLPRYVHGVTFHDKNLVSIIHMSTCMRLALEGTPEVLLIAEIVDQTFGLLVDADRGEWSDKDFTLKALPLLTQSGWMRHALVHSNEIIPVLEPGRLISNQTDGWAGTPLPQRYTPSSDFKSIFGKQDVKVCEFSLYGVRHAVPELEVEDQIRVKAYRPLPKGMSIVAGVVQHAGDLLPVLDLAACFGRCSQITPDWQMLLVSNGDFRALVLTEAVFGERLLPLSMHRELPFDEPNSLVYGCYPDEATVRLVLNVQALAVYFDKTLYKEFFTSLSREIALEPMAIRFESEPGNTETRELSEKYNAAAEVSEPEEVEKSPKHEWSTDLAAANSATKENQEIGIQQTGETALQDLDESVAEEKEMIELESEVKVRDAPEAVETEAEESQAGSAESKAKKTQVAISQKIENEAELKKAESGVQLNKMEESTELQDSIGPEQKVFQTLISEKITPQTASEEEEQKEHEEEFVELLDFIETEEAIEVEERTETMALEDNALPIDEAADDDEIIQTRISDLIAPQTESEKQAPQNQEVEFAELLNFSEPEEAIKFEEAPETAVFGSGEDAAAQIDESTDEEEIFQTRNSEKIALQTESEKEEQKEHEEEIVELLDFIETEEPVEVENASERTVLASGEDVSLPIAEATDDDEVFRTRTSDNLSPQKTLELNEQKEQEEEITDIQDFMEPEELIEVNEAPESMVPVSTEVTTLPIAETANDYFQSDVRKKPNARYAVALFAAILLLGLLTVMLNFSDLFHNMIVSTEKGKRKAPIVVSPPVPTQEVRSKVSQSRKPKTKSPDPKIVDVKNERTVLADAVEKSQPSAKKVNIIQQPEKAPKMPLNAKVIEAPEEKTDALVKLEIHRPTPTNAVKPQPPEVVSPESTGTAIHNVKNGDTLWDISKKYTGTGFNYKRVAKENEIANPDLIFPKQKLRIYRKQKIKN